MQFSSVQFVLFFFIACVVYFVVPKKARVPWLVICSYAFYGAWGLRYAGLLAVVTVTTFFLGLAAEKRPSKWIPAAGGVFTLGLLGFFRYTSVFLPVGLSFYALQALGYLIDIYRGDCKAERNLLRYALFAAFFPKLTAGPIERAAGFLPQIRHTHETKLWDAERVTRGAILVVWGLFLKMVIADRAALLADTVWEDPFSYGRITLLLATLAFTLQIYGDIAGYSCIAIGAARILGFDLTDNFDAPYLALRLRDFWTRWHISLTSWFRDYLYVPLSGDGREKGRKYAAIFVTFLVFGIWHRLDLSFLVWGGIHGVGLLIEDAFTSDAGKRTHKRVNYIAAAVRWGITMAFVNFTWVFFRAPDLSSGIRFFKLLVRSHGVNDLIIGKTELAILAMAACITFAFDWVCRRQNKTIDAYLMTRRLSSEWGILIFLIVCILVFGEYGPGFDPKTFLCFQF